MDATEEENDSLWSELEAEFESQSSPPVKLDLQRPPSRRRTLRVAHDQALFSGFYPAFAICLFATVVGQWPGDTASGWWASILAFPMAVALAPLLRDPKRGLGFYAAVGWLAGGGTHLGVYLLELGVDSMGWTVWSGQGWLDEIIVLQRQMERFLRPESCLVYSLCGVLVGILTSVSKKRCPWLDSPPTPRIRVALAALVLAIPLLIPLGSGLLGRVLYREPIQWFAAINSAHPERQEARSRRTDEERWQLFAKERAAGTGPMHRPTDRKGNANAISVEDIQQIDQDFLLMLPSREKQQWTAWACRGVEDLLLSRRRDLEKPLSTTWNIAERAMWERAQGGGRETLGWLLDIMLAELSLADLSQAERELLSQRIAALKGQLRPDLEELDSRVLFLLESRYDSQGGPTPLKALGMEWVYSPSQVYFQYRFSEWLDIWLDLRAEIAALEPSQQLAKLREMSFKNERKEALANSLLAFLSEFSYASDVRPQLEAAEVLLAIRQYQKENGAWPDGVRDLADHLSFAAPSSRWEFTVLQDGLRVNDKLLMTRAPLVQDDVFPPRVQRPGQWTLL